MLADAVAAVLLVGISAYAMFGGADFGAGFWDLVAGGAERGSRPRQVIEHAIAPVWEANHVWLIFCLVVLWTGFPPAFAAVTTVLFAPLAIAAFGIVLRGSGFAFRKVTLTTAERRRYGAVFACSSVVVPFCMGAVAGGVASGRVRVAAQGHPWSAWLNPTSVLAGVLAVTACAYLASVYLTWDARRIGDEDLVHYFRWRAVGSAVVCGVVAVAGIFVVRDDAPFFFHGLTHRGLPLVVLSGVAGVGSAAVLAALLDRWPIVPAISRLLAMGAVLAVIWGWGLAQWPYLLPKTLTVAAGAAPSPTLWSVLVVFGVAAVTIVPALGLLYLLDQRSLLHQAETPSPE